MARIISTTDTAEATGTTYALSLPSSGYQADDYLFACLTQNTGGTTISLGSDSVTVSSDAGAKFTYTTGANDFWDNGEQIILTGSMPGGFTSGTRYYIRELNTTTNTFYLETSVGVGRIAYSSAGSSVIAHRMTGGASANNNCVGWKMVGTQAAFADHRQVWAYKIAISGAESNPTFTGSNDYWRGTCVVVRYADTTGTILWQRSDWGGTNAGIPSGTSNAVATSSAGGTTAITAPEDALLLYSWCSDGGLSMRCKADELTAVSRPTPNFTSHIIGYRQHGASGNPANVTMYSVQANEGGNGWVISIPNDSGGALENDCRIGIEEVEWFGSYLQGGTVSFTGSPSDAVATYSGTPATTDPFSNGMPVQITSLSGSLPGGLASSTAYYVINLDTTANTFKISDTLGGAAKTISSNGTNYLQVTPGFGAPSDVLTTVNGISVDTVRPSVSVGTLADYPVGGITTLTNNTSTTSLWAGGTYKFTTAKNFTGKIISVGWSIDMASTNSRAGAEGSIIVFSDGTNYAAYRLSTRSLYVIGAGFTVLIDPANSVPYATSGSINWAAVTHVVFLYHRAGSSTTGSAISIKNLFLMGTAVMLGGGEDFPTDFVTLYDAAVSWGALDAVNKQGSAQILGKAKVQIGNGTDKLYWDTSGAGFEFPIAYSASDQTAKKWNCGTDSVSINIKAAAGNTINLASGSITTSVPQAVTIDAASSLSATYSVAGQSFKGLSGFTDNAGIALTGPTYKECGTVSLKANMTGMNVSKTEGAVPAVAMTASGKTLQSCTIDLTGTTATYFLSLSSAVTAITINATTLTGTPNNTDADKIYSELASGTLTITVDGTGTSIVAGDVEFIGGSTAVASVVAPTYYRGLNFTGLVAGSKVKVFAPGSQTVLYGTDSSGTSFAFDDSTNGATTVDYTIQKAGYVPIRVTGAALNGSTVQATGRPDTAVSQVIDRAYLTGGSTGLTYTTNCTINATTKIVTWSVATTGQNLYSFFIEQWIDKGDTGEALANVAFPFTPNGPNSITFGDGWESRGFTVAGTGYDNTSLDLWTRDGLRYLSAAGVLTAAWCAILTSGASNKQVRYQQADNGTTYDGTMLANEMDQLVQIYGDATHGNFDKSGFIGNNSYLILKIQAEGYDQAESNVVTLYGQLEDQLYVVGLTPTANGIATGNPTVTLALTREVVNDVTSGKTFGIKIVSANTGEDIMRELRYNFGAGGEYPAASGYDGFDWHDLVQTNGADFKTVRGTIYGPTAVKGVIVYMADGVTLHPDFTLFTADDGTTYSPPVTADISITGMPNDAVGTTRLQIRNTTAEAASAWAANTVYATGAIVKRVAGLGTENTLGLYFRAITGGTSHLTTEPTWVTTTPGVSTTTDNTVTWLCCAVLYYDADPGATSLTDTYIDGEEFLAGETVDIRFAEMNGASTFKTYDTTVITTSAGFSALVSEEAEPVFATYAIDGSTQDGIFSPNYTSSRVVMDANIDFSGKGAFAYYCYVLTTSEGMARFWGGVTAVDAGNIRINTSILNLYFDESAGFVKQTDDVRIYRDDDTRPAIDPTTGGHGIEINWRTPVSVVSTGGSALTPAESAYLLALPSASANATAVVTKAVDGTTTLAESLALSNAVLGGKVSGAGTGTETFRDLADTKDRVVATVDTDGNRTAITRDLT